MADDRTPGDAAPLPPYVIEGARSGRSRCKTCRRAIAKESVRIGVLITGPFGEGYLWHHLTCLARSRFAQVETAYAEQAWEHAKVEVKGLPTLASLAKLEAKAQRQREEKRELPYLELAPSSRSRCKQCGEAIAEGAPRVVLGRTVTLGRQTRTAEVKVHPACVAAELERDDSAAEAAGFAAALRANSAGIDERTLDDACAAVGLA